MSDLLYSISVESGSDESVNSAVDASPSEQVLHLHDVGLLLTFLT